MSKKTEAFLATALLMGILVFAGWHVYQDLGVAKVAQAQISVNDYEEQIQMIEESIGRFESVDLNVAFLNSPEFRNLKDFSVDLPRPADVGRENPFEPLPEIDPESFSILPERDTEENATETIDSFENFNFEDNFLDEFLF